MEDDVLERLRTSLSDRYRIIGAIGMGGMATIYQAEDLKHGRKVALKVLHPELAAAVGTERFLREIEIAAQLSHPNILPVFDSGDADGLVFYVTPFVEGGSLRDRLNRERQLPIDESLRIVREVADALGSAHRAGVIHRDIKPENILLEEGHAVVADFGIAMAVTADNRRKLTDSGVIIGTVEYMSPEQATGEGELDERTDVYSLATVLYETLVGEPPYTGPTVQAIIARRLLEPVPGLRTVRDAIPAQVERTVMKALAKAPADRYSSASEFAETLTMAEMHGDRPGTARLRRWPTFASSALVVAAVLLVLWQLASKPAVSLSVGDRILLADFDNQTGEEVFDKSLGMAMTISLEQSPYVSVYPRQRVREALQRMKKSDVETIDVEIGREIAEREGISLVIAPSITRVGHTYALAAAIVDPGSGSTLGTALVRAAAQDSVLAALDELTRQLRSEVGEAARSIEERSEPLDKVTTQSLAALKLYSLGAESRREARFEEAKAYFERALRLDSTFVSAKASLGMLHIEQARWNSAFDVDTGQVLMEEALQHLDELAEGERYALLTFDAMLQQDYQRAVEYQETLASLLPNGRETYNNLGVLYGHLGRYGDAIAAYREAIRIDPYLMVAYNGLGNIYLYNLSNLDSTLAWADRQLGLDSTQVWAWDRRGWVYLCKDSLERAVSSFQQGVRHDSAFARDYYRLGHAYRLQGRYAEATETLERLVEKQPDEADAQYQLGVNYRLLGDEQAARRHFERYRSVAEGWVQESPDDAPSRYALAIALAELGDLARSRVVGEQALALDPTEHLWAAWMYAVQGRPDDAMTHLERLVEEGYWSFVWIKIHIGLRSLYSDPRFQKLVGDAIGG